MSTYIMLNRLTDQGIRNIKDTTNRHEATREMANRFGVTVKGLYWTLGEYDVVGIYDAVDEKSMTAFALAVSMAGNVRTEVMRAMDKDEMKGVIEKLVRVKDAAPA